LLRAAGLIGLAAAATAVGLAAAPLPRPEVRFSRPGWIGPVAIVDVETGTVRRGKALRIERGRIAAVTDMAAVPPRDRPAMLNAGGAYVTPGLWDMHAVLTRYAGALEHPLYLGYGVTRLRSILDCPAEGKASLYACGSHKRRWNRDVRAGRLIGAITLGSGSFPVAGPRRLHRDLPDFYGAATPAEARRLVRFIAGQPAGPDHIKTYDGLTRDSFFALMAEAKARGIEVSGHVPAAVRVSEAAAAGLKAVAHARALPIGCSTREGEIMRLRSAARPAAQWMRLALQSQHPAACAALWRTLTRRGTFVSPTLITRYSETRAGLAELRGDPATQRATPPLFEWIWSEDIAPVEARRPEEEAVYAAFYRAAARRTAEAEQAGVRLLAGSDTGDAFVAPGVGLHQEMALWRRAGTPPAAILRAATIDAAAYFGQSHRIGRIAPGYVADLVFTGGNPLVDLGTLREPQAVLQEGRLYDRRALADARGAAEQAAASWRFPMHVLRDLMRNPLGFTGS
jgi:hypothetical protein